MEESTGTFPHESPTRSRQQVDSSMTRSEDNTEQHQNHKRMSNGEISRCEGLSEGTEYYITIQPN